MKPKLPEKFLAGNLLIGQQRGVVSEHNRLMNEYGAAKTELLKLNDEIKLLDYVSITAIRNERLIRGIKHEENVGKTRDVFVQAQEKIVGYNLKELEEIQTISDRMRANVGANIEKTRAKMERIKECIDNLNLSYSP